MTSSRRLHQGDFITAKLASRQNWLRFFKLPRARIGTPSGGKNRARFAALCGFLASAAPAAWVRFFKFLLNPQDRCRMTTLPRRYVAFTPHFSPPAWVRFFNFPLNPQDRGRMTTLSRRCVAFTPHFSPPAWVRFFNFPPLLHPVSHPVSSPVRHPAAPANP